jgi:hypothetical protein
VKTLPANLRRQLENAIRQARGAADGGAREALEALAVHEPDPYRHMDEAQRDLRRKLRAQARQLGDGESKTRPGAYEIKHLVEKLAYDQWHRLLFSRFLLENHLLISPEHGVSVSLDDCEELAPSVGLKDAWAVAVRFAAKELPEIFRADDPAGAVELPPEDRKPLIQLVAGLHADVFTADDSLGWCYQFWQAEQKDKVNAAGNKIGEDELAAVTQLFTEDYMVDFLLHNTIGAWWAGREAELSSSKFQASSCRSEGEAREAVALSTNEGVPAVDWNYLRLVKREDSWCPAAGTFDRWPKTVKEIRLLDPCMGSGHFLVFALFVLVRLRMEEERLSAAEACIAVLRDNLFGLELDARCTQIAAFNLALAAWKLGGYQALPPLSLACSGLGVNAREADWLRIAGDSEKLQRGMQRLYQLFRQAPALGSLISPRALGGDLLVAEFHDLQPLVERALEREKADDAYEMAVTAQGVTKAAEILASQFTLIATNVPYLGRGNQDDILRDFIERHYPSGKADLATAFVLRCLEFCREGGSTALVTPQNWLFLNSYKKLRDHLLKRIEWDVVARLGARAFETIGGEVVNVALLVFTCGEPADDWLFFGVDVAEAETPKEKANSLMQSAGVLVNQAAQRTNPDAIVQLEDIASDERVGGYAFVRGGITSGDSPHFRKRFWEINFGDSRWAVQQSTVDGNFEYAGREYVLLWEDGRGELSKRTGGGGATIAGREAWRRQGVAITYMSGLYATLYYGELFENVICVLCPKSSGDLPALWCFCSSDEFGTAVRQVNQKLSVDVRYFEKARIDLARWRKVAAKKYPHGLPKPHSNDPTQWLFSGHPSGATEPLQVAVARLLGYQWPRQTGSSFPDCPALGLDGLEELADADGIVCLSPTRGEAPAAERVRGLLVQALGNFDLKALIANAGPKGSKSETLEAWLRDEFFDQHCEIFHDRPFIWHVWDGHKSGFSALVNYHQLTHANLEKLAYAYLGDWIRRQQAAVDAGEAGSDARLQAAKHLQSRLKLILEGEPPYDIFVRWKPLSQQANGWHPDLNDGVRINIRPFLVQEIPAGKKGAGILRTRPNIKWGKDRGKEPMRDKDEFPWFWGWDEEKQDFAGIGAEPDGNRWNDCHYTNEFKQRAKTAQ